MKQATPMQLRPKHEVVMKIKQIAKVNGLSFSDVANLCLASGLGMVETKLKEIREPEKAA